MTLAPNKPTARDLRQAPAAHVSGGCTEAQVSAGCVGAFEAFVLGLHCPGLAG